MVSFFFGRAFLTFGVLCMSRGAKRNEVIELIKSQFPMQVVCWQPKLLRESNLDLLTTWSKPEEFCQTIHFWIYVLIRWSGGWTFRLYSWKDLVLRFYSKISISKILLCSYEYLRHHSLERDYLDARILLLVPATGILIPRVSCAIRLLQTCHFHVKLWELVGCLLFPTLLLRTNSDYLEAAQNYLCQGVIVSFSLIHFR
jgi:hypothetical protein